MRRRTFLTGVTGAVLAVPPEAHAHPRDAVHVRPGDRVQAAVDSVTGPGRTIVLHPGAHREVVDIPADKAEPTLRGAIRRLTARRPPRHHRHPGRTRSSAGSTPSCEPSPLHPPYEKGPHSMSRRTVPTALAALCLGAGLAVALPVQAQAATVVVSNSTDLSNAIKNAAAGTVIQVRGGTYYPTATLQSTANGTSSAPVTLTAYGSETVKIDGSSLPAGDWIFKLTADYWNVAGITFQNSPDSAVVCQSCTGTVWTNIKTINGGDSGFTLTGDGTVNNTVRDIDAYGNYDAAGHGENADGVAVKFGSGTGNLITGARLYNNSDDGIDFWSFSSPATVEHTWSFGNGVNRWSDPAFAGDGNGYKLGGDGEVVAHVVNNSAAWGNAGNGFTENSNTGAIVINRTTAYANSKWGYYFATGSAKLGKNLAVGNGGGAVSKGSPVTSAGNNWDSGVATPAFRSTDASTTYNARGSSGTLPTTTFLTTGSTTIGATMD